MLGSLVSVLVLVLVLLPRVAGLLGEGLFRIVVDVPPGERERAADLLVVVVVVVVVVVAVVVVAVVAAAGPAVVSVPTVQSAHNYV